MAERDNALFQQEVGGMERNKEGGFVGAQFYPTNAVVTGEVIRIGKPVFYRKATGYKTLFMSGDVFAGVVPATDQNSWTWAQTEAGYSMLVMQGRNVGVMAKGKVSVFIDKNYAGDSKFCDEVFVNVKDGTFATGVTTQPNYMKTDFVVLTGGPEKSLIDIGNDALPVNNGVTK
ncbi:MAG: hypothetical protein EKK64_10975 [Neisseriaceae bacterium]|nr:MAG: hypothetical protein EKK64_10975 [Neisseriaceae bacterium]